MRDPRSDAREALWELIHGIKFAMFTTRHDNGHLHSRPMTTQNSELDEESSLWFFMSHKSESVADLRTDPTVNVVYADPDADSYISVSGTASVVNNPAKKQQLWSKAAEAWFPGGMHDPDLALVQVKITHANYWDVKASKIVQLYNLAKAVVTGHPSTGLGEEKEVRMD